MTKKLICMTPANFGGKRYIVCLYRTAPGVDEFFSVIALLMDPLKCETTIPIGNDPRVAIATHGDFVDRIKRGEMLTPAGWLVMY